MISDKNSEVAFSNSQDDITFNGDFLQNPKNVDIIKTALNSSDEIKNNFLYYSDKIECIPSIVHFSGFNVNTTQKQFIRIINKGTKKIRINVKPPETSNFSIEHKKRGYIIPQMSEEVLISFTPTQWKYYYDTIKIVGPDINVTIPIHGYPVLTDIDFPKRINFGEVPLAYTKKKIIPIKCNIPIDFEFKIDITEPNPFYNIYPLKGVIPALGSIDIVIEYKPCSYRSSHLTFQIDIAQFNFKPYKVKVFGTCLPNLLLQKTNDLIKQVYGKKKKKYGNDNETDDYDMNMDDNDKEEFIDNKIENEDEKEENDDDKNNTTDETLKIPLKDEDPEPIPIIIKNPFAEENEAESENKKEIEDENSLLKPAKPQKKESIIIDEEEETKNEQDEADSFIANFNRRKEYEKYKEMHRFVCVGEDIPEEDDNDDSSSNKITIPDIIKKEPKINYESIKQSQNILVGHDIKNYYFFENDNFKKDWESKERIVKKFLRLHYKNIYQIRAKKLLENFREWKQHQGNKNYHEKKKKMLRERRASFAQSLFQPINDQEKEYINKLNKNDESMKLFLPHSIVFDESHPFRKPYTIKPIEINHIPLWNPIPFQEPLEYQLLNYQPQPDISISEYLFSNVNQNVVDKTEEIKIVKRSKKYYIPEMPLKLVESNFIPLEIYNPHQYARNSINYWNVKIHKNIEFEMFKPPTDSLQEISKDNNIQRLTTLNLYASRNMIQNENIEVSFYLDNKLCANKFQIEKHSSLLNKIWKDIRDETKEREEREERKRLNKIKNLNRYKKLQVNQSYADNEDDESSKRLTEKKNENELIEDISSLVDFQYCSEFLSFLYE